MLVQSREASGRDEEWMDLRVIYETKQQILMVDQLQAMSVRDAG